MGSSWKCHNVSKNILIMWDSWNEVWPCVKKWNEHRVDNCLLRHKILTRIVRRVFSDIEGESLTCFVLFFLLCFSNMVLKTCWVQRLLLFYCCYGQGALLFGPFPHCFRCSLAPFHRLSAAHTCSFLQKSQTWLAILWLIWSTLFHEHKISGKL